MTTEVNTAVPSASIELSKIRVKDNVRQALAVDDVDALAGSIKLLGVLQPVLVAPLASDDRADGCEYELVAGYTRYAACEQLGLPSIPYTTRDVGEDRAADTAAARAAENIVRTPLNAYEEAIAVQAMLDKGLTEQGAGQALGWSAQKVAARVKLLDLPPKAQAMVGSGDLPLSNVDQLRAIGQVSSEILEVIVDFIAENPGYVDYLQRDLGQLLRYAKRELDSNVFVVQLVSIDANAIEALKLGKKTTDLYAQLGELDKKARSWGNGRPTVRFADAEVDQARAAGVLIEGVGSPLIADKSVYRELVKQAIARSFEEATASAVELAAERQLELAERKAQRAADPEAEVRREHGRTMRGIAEQAHGANTDLGWSLRNGLSAVDPASMDVARFFVYALLETGYSWGTTDVDSDKVIRLATTGVRLVVDEFRQDVTKTKANGERGVLKIQYGGNDSAPERAWLWKYVEGAKTAGDLYGRALVVIAAEHYACRLVLPQSRQGSPITWGSRQGKAIKALEKLAGPHVPASLKQLQKAIAKAKAEQDTQLEQARQAARKARAAKVGPEHVDYDDSDEFDGDVDDLDDYED